MGADSSTYDMWTGAPSFSSFLVAGIARLLAYLLILSVSVLPVLGALLFVTVGQGTAVLVVGGITLAFTLVVLLRLVLRYTNASYELDGQTLTVTSGSFGSSTTRIDCRNIESIQLQQNAINEFFDTGTLEIRVEGQTLVISHVSSPQKVLAEIEQETGERKQASED